MAQSPSLGASASDIDIAGFKEVINTIDSLSQTGFSNISTLARMALACMEHPRHADHPETIAKVLQMIWYYADDTENSINCEAESVGCNYKDQNRERRHQARLDAKARKGATNV